VTTKQLQGNNEGTEMLRQLAMAPARASLNEFVVQVQGNKRSLKRGEEVREVFISTPSILVEAIWQR